MALVGIPPYIPVYQAEFFFAALGTTKKWNAVGGGAGEGGVNHFSISPCLNKSNKAGIRCCLLHSPFSLSSPFLSRFSSLSHSNPKKEPNLDFFPHVCYWWWFRAEEENAVCRRRRRSLHHPKNPSLPTLFLPHPSPRPPPNLPVKKNKNRKENKNNSFVDSSNFSKIMKWSWTGIMDK